MELRHLKYFCAVAEHRSFTMAARQLNVSQSGVSGQVKDLEREVGLPLLRRNKREVALTPGGLVFLAEARDILTRAGRAVELAHLASRGQGGKITVGLCGPVTAAFLPKVISMFRKQHPGAALSVRERAPSEQIEALLKGQIDIGFTRSIPANTRHLLGFQVMFREPVILALPRTHALAQLPAVPVTRLASERLILYARDGAPEVFDAITAMCRRARFSPQVVDTPRSWHSVLTMVESQEGLALIPQCVQHLKGNNLVFRPLSDGGCKLDAMVAWRKNEPDVLQESFLNLVKGNLPQPPKPGKTR